MRYFKQTDGRLVEYSGPQMGAAWYAAEGWLPYTGTLGVDWLHVVNGVIVAYTQAEHEALYPPPPKRYSRYKIIEKLGENWESIENGMSFLERSKFYGTTFLERGNSDFEAFLEKVRPSMPDIDTLLEDCYY